MLWGSATDSNIHEVKVRGTKLETLRVIIMPPLNILYYPTWNPPPEYLRSVLLFFDRFEVIIPTDVPAEYDDANARIIDVLPDAFYERRERHYEFDLDALGWQRFERALDLLVEQKPPAKGVRPEPSVIYSS